MPYPIRYFQKQITLLVCSYPVTLDSVGQHQAKNREYNAGGWFERRKSFPQHGGKDKESSALTFAHKLAYMWFLDSPKRCWLYPTRKGCGMKSGGCICTRGNTGLNRGHCREFADGIGGGASLWRCWMHFVNLTAYSTSLPICLCNNVTTFIKKIHVSYALEVQRLSWVSGTAETRCGVPWSTKSSLGKGNLLQDSPLNSTKIKFGIEGCLFVLKDIRN